MPEQLKNSLDNPTSTVATGIDSDDTSLVVATGHGSRFPSTGTFRVKLTDQSDNTVYELVRCTARSSDTLTIVRATEGTTGTAFVTGDYVDLVMSVAGLDNYLAPLEGMPPTGAISETMPRYIANSNNGVLNTGRLNLTAIWLPGATIITSITFVSGTTAVITPTNQLFGIFDDSAGSSGGSGYALLRASNNDTSTAWAADTAKTLSLTSTYTTVRSRAGSTSGSWSRRARCRP